MQELLFGGTDFGLDCVAMNRAQLSSVAPTLDLKVLQSKEEDILFDAISGSALNMVHVGIPHKQAQKFIRNFCFISDLSDGMMLLPHSVMRADIRTEKMKILMALLSNMYKAAPVPEEQALTDGRKAVPVCRGTCCTCV